MTDTDDHKPGGQPDQVSHLALIDLPVVVGWARRHTIDVLRAWGLDGDVLDTSELLTSELVTNALRHAAAEGADSSRCTDCGSRVCLTLRHTPACVTIEVFDNGDQFPRAQKNCPEAESGRGLMLVASLSKEWAFHFPPTGGKVVWCTVAVEN